jgi:hypothetical protein
LQPRFFVPRRIPIAFWEDPDGDVERRWAIRSAAEGVIVIGSFRGEDGFRREGGGLGESMLAAADEKVHDWTVYGDENEEDREEEEMGGGEGGGGILV